MKTRTESLLKKISLAIAGVALTALAGGCSNGSQVDDPAVNYAYTIYSTPGIVSHWLMNETTGTTAFDTLGVNNGTYTFGTNAATPGITMGVPGPLYGYSNTAIAFSPPASSQDATNSGEIIVPYNSNMFITGAMSIEAWINFAPGAINNTWAKVMWMGMNGSYAIGEGPWGYELYNSSSSLSFHIAVDTGHTGIGRDLKAYSTFPVNDGNWHHVVSTYDPTQFTDSAVVVMYIDGVAQTLNFVYYSDQNGNTYNTPSGCPGDTGNKAYICDPGKLPGSEIAASSYTLMGWQEGLVIAGSWTTPTGTFPAGAPSIGYYANSGSNQHFNGSFANMAFYNQALSQAMVLSHYNLGKYGN